MFGLVVAWLLALAPAPARAIEPLPVNKQLMEEFWAHAAENKQRGEKVQQLDEAWEMQLVPSLHAGTVGWCAVLRYAAQPFARCPVSPLEGPEVLYEAWEGTASVTHGYALVAEDAPAVTVNQGSRIAVATAPVKGFPLRAAAVTIPAPFPGVWPDQFIGVVRGFVGSGKGWTAPPLTPSLTLPTAVAPAPQAPPAAPCGLSVRGVKGVRRITSSVVPTLTALAHVAGRGYLSCADSEYAYGHARLDVALLLDAAEPGQAPVAIPNAAPVQRHPGLYQAPGLYGELLGRRLAGAWLLAEGGSLAQRLKLLAHVRASVRP